MATERFWPASTPLLSSPWEAVEAGRAAEAVRRKLAARNTRDGTVLVSRFGSGTAPAFWAGLFDRIVTIRDSDSPFTVRDEAEHRLICGPMSPAFRLRTREAIPPLDALVIDAPDLPGAVVQYFLFRRCLRPPAVVLFAADPRNPGAGALADRLREGAFGVPPAIETVIETADGGRVALERIECLPEARRPTGNVPAWTPPSSGIPPADPTLDIIIADLHGYRVFRWFGCFAASRLPMSDRPETIFDGTPEDYLVARTLPEVVAAVQRGGAGTEDAGHALAAVIRSAAERRQALIWGMGSDLLRALCGRPDLGEALRVGRLQIADRDQAGKPFCGHPVLTPDDLASLNGPIILAAAAARAGMRAHAERLGITARLVDPYPTDA
ncbi:hypothetical protein [Azospirillum sp. Marseille-Q6669]